VKETKWSRNEIDRFVLARLEKEGLKPSPAADKVTLIRRVTLDLTGLPPTPAEVEAFLADKSADADEKVVERLLKSPRYGEHMAKYWLDAARYADSHGYHIDSERSMWKWRDWVVEAFNQNKPYDQFTIEQLAGDLLPEATTEQKVASGYVRANMSTGEGGAIEQEYQCKYTFDRVETTSTIWLGLTMTCARCHTHKYDPIQHREYYGLYAFFNNLNESIMDGNKPNPDPFMKLPTPEQSKRQEELKKLMAEGKKQIEAPAPELDAAQAAWVTKWHDKLSAGWTTLLPVNVVSTVSWTDGESDSIAAGRRFGNYVLLEVIGQGGNGIVWRARQLQPDRVVALKMLLFGKSAAPDEIQRFKLESEVTARLSHPNIVQVYEVGEMEGQHFFSMEHVEGPNLAELSRGRPLTAKTAARYVKLIAEAVQFAHRNGVIHRDLKPSNILLDPHDQPRLTDFGLARLLEGGSNLTMSGKALGSLPYASPEQASGQRLKVGVASDVYSLGGTLYHLLTGRAPFTGETHAVILRQVLETDPVAPQKLNPSVPPDLETICLKCLQKHPGQRYAGAQALADDLGRYLGGEMIHARPISAAEKAWRWCLRHPKEALLRAALVIGSGLLIGLQLSAAQAKKEQQLRQLFILDSQYARLAAQSAGWPLRVSNSAALAAKAGLKPDMRDQMAALLPGMDATLVRRLGGLDEVEIAAGPPGPKVLILHKSSVAASGQPKPVLKVWDYQTDQTEEFQLRGNGAVAWLSNAVPLQLV
jgi:predicted Ser/Thr protein kinase